MFLSISDRLDATRMYADSAPGRVFAHTRSINMIGGSQTLCGSWGVAQRFLDDVRGVLGDPDVLTPPTNIRTDSKRVYFQQAFAGGWASGVALGEYGSVFVTVHSHNDFSVDRLLEAASRRWGVTQYTSQYMACNPTPDYGSSS